MKKGELSRKRLIEGLFYCLGEYGVEATTFQKVADHCEVSQTLVVKVFKNREAMLWTAFTELIAEAVRITESMIGKSTNAAEKLEDYFRVSIEIFRQRKQTSQIYILLYYLSSIDPKYLAFNTKLKEVAILRITKIIREGIDSGEFKFKGDINVLAKVIHSSLTGLLINAATEISNYDVKALSQSFLQVLQPTLSSASVSL